MLSLLAQRVPLRASASALAAARQTPLSAAFALAARRTFLSAAPAAEPAKGTTTAKKASTGDTSVTKAKPKKTKAATEGKGTKTKAAKPVKEAAPKKKVAKKEAPKKVKIAEEDKPPKVPPSPYIIFTTKFRAGRTITSMADATQIAREAGAAWRALTELEKQAFHSEYEDLRKDYIKRRDEYWANVDPAIVRELNRKRKEKGQSMIRAHRAADTKKPPSAYLRFTVEQFPLIPGNRPIEKTPEIARRWHALSEEEKKPYFDAANKAMEEWKAKNPDGQQNYV